MLTASYLYMLCQAMDLRAIQDDFLNALEEIVKSELTASYSSFTTDELRIELAAKLMREMHHTLDKTTNMDNLDRMNAVASSTSTILLSQFTSSGMAAADVGAALAAIPDFQARVAARAAECHEQLRKEFLSGARGPAPAAQLLGKTKVIYTYIRQTLGIRMHGAENHGGFVNGIGRDDVTIGENISKIYEVPFSLELGFPQLLTSPFQSIRDGKMEDVVLSIFY